MASRNVRVKFETALPTLLEVALFFPPCTLNLRKSERTAGFSAENRGSSAFTPRFRPCAPRFRPCARRFRPCARRFCPCARGFAPAHGGFAPAHGRFAPVYGGFATAHGGFARAHGDFAHVHGGLAHARGRFATAHREICPCARGRKAARDSGVRKGNRFKRFPVFLSPSNFGPIKIRAWALAVLLLRGRLRSLLLNSSHP
jgi:hypothetical protein